MSHARFTTCNPMWHVIKVVGNAYQIREKVAEFAKRALAYWLAVPPVTGASVVAASPWVTVGLW